MPKAKKNAEAASAATPLSVPAGWAIENGYYITPMEEYKLTKTQASRFIDVLGEVDGCKVRAMQLIKGDELIDVAERNMQDLMGCDDSEVNATSSPLGRSPVNQSRRDQDSRSREAATMGMGGSAAHVVGRHSSSNEDQAVQKKEGATRVLNVSLPVPEAVAVAANDRSCLVDSLFSVLKGDIRRAVYADIRAAMPSVGDTPVKIGNMALASHGMYLKRVYEKFDKKPGGFAYNVLQLRECQMVLALDPMMADGSGVAHHCIGWDGATLWDRLDNIIVNNTRDRSHPKFARMVFDKLYPKETYKDWRVVQAFAIANISNKKTRTRRKRKRSAIQQNSMGLGAGQ